MYRIRKIVYGTSLVATLAVAVIGGTGANSALAAPSSAQDRQGCIIAILKSGRAQEVNAIAQSTGDDASCVVHIRKTGGDPQDFTARKAGGDQQEY